MRFARRTPVTAVVKLDKPSANGGVEAAGEAAGVVAAKGDICAVNPFGAHAKPSTIVCVAFSASASTAAACAFSCAASLSFCAAAPRELFLFFCSAVLRSRLPKHGKR